MREKILFIEDDKNLLLSLRIYFLEKNFLVEQANTGATGLALIDKATPDIVVLDLGLPDIQGETVCQKIKSEYPDLPVIILTAKNTSEDAVRGLGFGADDYMAKPFNLEELHARIKTRLKKNTGNKKIIVADLIIDPDRYEVIRSGKRIDLTLTEFRLLEYLAKNKGKVVSRESILNRVWSYGCDVQTRVIDVYIGYLRKKIDSSYKVKLIRNIRGFGYTIEAN